MSARKRAMNPLVPTTQIAACGALAIAAFLSPNTAAATEPVGYVTEPLELYQDPEDAPGPRGERDFYASTEAFSIVFSDVVADPEGRYFAGSLSAMLETNSGLERTAPHPAPGKGWAVLDVLHFPFIPVIGIRAAADPDSLAFFHADGFHEIARVDLVPLAESDSNGDWPFATAPAAIENGRIYFRGMPPEGLRDLLSADMALPRSTRWWCDHAHQEERYAVENWRFFLEESLAAGGVAEPAFALTGDIAELPFLKSLAENPPAPLPQSAALEGEWQVRSIQFSRGFLVAYPWFRAAIHPGDRPGELRFEKTTGSQRRSGVLLPAPGEKDLLIFLGGTTVNEEPQIGYSGLADNAIRSRIPSDTGGVLFHIGANRLVMVFDITDAAIWEVYELKR